MSSFRERSQTTKPNGSIPRGGRLLSPIFALSRNPNRLPPRTRKKGASEGESKFFDTSREAASSLNEVNGMSDMEGSELSTACPPWWGESSTGLAFVTRVGARSEPDLHCGQGASFKWRIDI